MNTKQSIVKAYDHASAGYAAAFWNEFEGKPFDRMILRWLAERTRGGEPVLEIGCGPGEVSGFLTDLGVDCLGTDISSEMIENARRCFPKARFEIQDFFDVKYPDCSFSAVVAFYAIVNWKLDQLVPAFKEVRRVLRPNGFLLLSFHIREAEPTLEVDKFFDKDDSALTFYFFDVDDVRAALQQAGFICADTVIRYPYKDKEYQSKRAYIVARKSDSSEQP